MATFVALSNGSGSSATATVPSQGGPHSDYLVRVWETEHGLPEHSATAVAQAPDGSIWLGTFNGLARFNGVTFTALNPDNTPQLPSAGIVNLHADRFGRLWISTFEGLVIRDGMEWISVPPPAGAGPNDYVRTFSERANGDVLVTTFHGRILQFTSRSPGHFVELPVPGVEGQGYLGGVDEDGHWWVVQNKFVGRWTGGEWVRMFSVPDLPPDAVGCGQARSGGLWILLADQLIRIRRGVEAFRVTLAERPGGVWSLSEDSRGNVWISTYNQGFCRVSPGGRLTRWTGARGWSDSARCVFEDREHNLWLGTSGDGLLQLTARRFLYHELIEGRKGAIVQSISAEPSGGILAGTYGHGLFRLGFKDAVTAVRADLGVKSSYLQSVLADRSGRVWVGTLGEQLRLVNHQGAVQPADFGPGNANVVALFEDSKGRVWSSNGGDSVSRFDGKELRRLGADDGLNKVVVRCFGEEKSGVIWLAGETAVYRALRDGFFEEVKDASGVSIRRVACLKGDSEGAMWLGTDDRGLLRWKNGQLNPIGVSQGLPVRGIRSLVEDGMGFLWMTGSDDLIRAQIGDLNAVADGQVTRLSCQRFTSMDGLPKAEFAVRRQPAATAGPHGRLWFATARGVTTVDPAAIQLNELPPPVEVEKISFYLEAKPETNRAKTGSPRRVRSELAGPFTGRVEVPAGSRRLEIHYAALSFVAPEKVQYQVTLEGMDNGWTEPSSDRRTLYYELPPKDYVFRVRASNNDGFWNEQGASLAFTVLPFFWQTAWFRYGTGLLLIVLGGTVAWGGFRRRLAAARERERASVEVQQLRDEVAHSSRVTTMGQLASSLAHELNQPLGAILRNAEAAEMLLEQTPSDIDELRAILGDIRQDNQRAAGVIDRMRALLKRRQVERTPQPLADLLQEVVALVRSDMRQRQVHLELAIAPGLPLIRGDRIQLQQVLLNLFINGMDAMAHQPADTRRLILQASSIEGPLVEVKVADTGPGIAEQDLPRLFDPFFSTKPNGMGLGLPISRTIIEAHGGGLWAENRLNGGACFRFTLPPASGKEKKRSPNL